MKVSVITTVYNGEQYICECVNSILGQTFKDFEMIIVDDGSTDNTASILSDFDDERIKIFNESRMGRGKVLNFAIAKSVGQYIAILDADDVALPDRLQLQVDYLNNKIDTDIVGAGKRMGIDGKGNVLWKEDWPHLTDQEIKAAFPRQNPIFHSSVMYRRAIYDRVGGYNDLLCLVDYDLYVRAARYSNFSNIPHYLTAKRRHGGQYFSRAVHNDRRANRVRMRICLNTIRYLGAPKIHLLTTLKYYIKSTTLGALLARKSVS